ncbi:uncharacterized protein BJ212DRAFT_1388447 [Suillus subaureus]|uniref:Uncharacterized protein n=1 Tax=Suillus subaureus TaxID=48587 RepID=A0A9P7J7W2_9AGAM|nr:uncharacterized protein BJ212DRAFT_1388447 [Suillus subaureus]KAG1806973.1 hypothetical protein BJ212DRAFT_1388447 [Suillus subaureus]
MTAIHGSLPYFKVLLSPRLPVISFMIVLFLNALVCLVQLRKQIDSAAICAIVTRAQRNTKCLFS